MRRTRDGRPDRELPGEFDLQRQRSSAHDLRKGAGGCCEIDRHRGIRGRADVKSRQRPHAGSRYYQLRMRLILASASPRRAEF